MSGQEKLQIEAYQANNNIKNEFELNIYDLSDCLDESFSNLDFTFAEFSDRNEKTTDQENEEDSRAR
jgi:hypothetical protein